MEIPFREDYPPRNDIVFSIMFGDYTLFASLVKAVTGHTLKAKEIISQANVRPDNVEHNYIRFDTFARDENGTVYSIDMQNTYSEMLIKNRTIYYACRALSGQTVEKGKYDKLNKVVISFIMTSVKHSEPIEIIHLCNQKNEIYSDLLTLYNVYTPSITDEEPDIPSDIRIFSDFFSVRTYEDMKVFCENYSGTEAGKRLIILYRSALGQTDFNNIKEREYFNMKITEQDINEAKIEAMAEGRAEGIAKGRAEGIAKGEARILKKLQALGNSIKQLSEMFDMPESEVESLLAMDV